MTVITLDDRAMGVVAAASLVILIAGVSVDGMSWQVLKLSTSPLEIYLWWRAVVAFYAGLKERKG